MSRPIVPFFIAHSGCPHRCIFCDQEKIAGASSVLPSPDEIRVRIASYRASGGGAPVEVAYYGGSFTSLARDDQLSLLSPLQPLIAAGEVASVRVSTRPDSVNMETAAFLKSLGVETVELGVQSMDEEVLALSERGHAASHVDAAFGFLRKEGLLAGAQLMPGLPGDTPEKSLASFRRVLALGPDMLRIYPTVVISGTRLEQLYRSGSYAPMDLLAAVQLCKVMLYEAIKVQTPVIRMGLQPTELLDGGAVAAGPYHPAFRQLVESELCLDLLLILTRGLSTPVKLACHPSRVSDVAGQRRGNIARLRDMGVEILSIQGDADLHPCAIRVDWDGGSRMGNMLENLDYPNP